MGFSDDELLVQNAENETEKSAEASPVIGEQPPPPDHTEEKRSPRPRTYRKKKKTGGEKKTPIGKSSGRSGTTDTINEPVEPFISEEEIRVLKEGSLYYIASMIPFGVISIAKNDPRWQLNQKQIDRMSIAYDKLMEKYMPALIQKAGAEIFFLSALMTVTAEKITEIVADNAERDESEHNGNEPGRDTGIN